MSQVAMDVARLGSGSDTGAEPTSNAILGRADETKV